MTGSGIVFSRVGDRERRTRRGGGVFDFMRVGGMKSLKMKRDVRLFYMLILIVNPK